MRPLLLGALFAMLSVVALPGGMRAVTAPLVFQTDMFGHEHVPPVDTVAWGFVRFFFNEDRTEAEYTVDVKGLSGSLVLGADIHRGIPGSNGPVVHRLADAGFIVTSGRLRLSSAEIEEMSAGVWYVSLKTTLHPDGELRGQIMVPADFRKAAGVAALEPSPAGGAPILPTPPEGAARISPPNVGDGGLAGRP